MSRALFLVALLGTGCSALGLTDGLDQEGCTSCADLNAIDPPPACMSWQCIDGLCALDVEDLDEDGVPSARCVPEDVPSDCDEADPTNGEGFEEACDGQDNDCDERVDEDVLVAARRAETERIEALSHCATDSGFYTVFRQGPAGSGLRLSRGGTSEPTVVDQDAAAGANPIETACSGSGGGIEVDIAFVPSGGCPRMVAGTWRFGSPMSLSGDAMRGLPKLGGSCPDDTSPVGSIAMASTGGRTLVVFRASDAPRDACPAPEASVGAAFGFSPAALEVGRSVGAPAAVRLGDRYVVAFAGRGGVELHEVLDTGGELTARLLSTEPCAGDGCHSVALARSSDPLLGAHRLGLAWREGACGDGAVRFRRWDATAEGLTPVDDAPIELAASGAIGPLAVVARREDLWGVAWSTSDDVRVQTIREDGLGVGPLTVPTSAPVTEPIGLYWSHDDPQLAFRDPGPDTALVGARVRRGEDDEGICEWFGEGDR